MAQPDVLAIKCARCGQPLADVDMRPLGPIARAMVEANLPALRALHPVTDKACQSVPVR